MSPASFTVGTDFTCLRRPSLGAASSPLTPLGRALLTVTFSVLAALALTACANRAGGAQARLAIDGLVAPTADRSTTPQLDGSTLTGTRLDIADWRGNVVVVNFWGSWCAPCRKEAPDLRRVATETYAKGVRFVGIDIRDNRDGAQAFEDSFHITYPSLFDPSSQQALAFGSLAPRATPSTFVLDRQGRVAARFIGATSYKPLLATVNQVLAQG